MGLLLVLCLVASVSAQYGFLSKQDVESAFTQDGWRVIKWVQYPNNTMGGNPVKGALAESLTATSCQSKQLKRAQYVEGTPYQQGYLTAMLEPEIVQSMTTTYIEHVLVEMISISVDVNKYNDTEYDEFLRVIIDVFNQMARESWDAGYAAGYFPESLQDEMKGIADACHALHTNEQCLNATFYSLVTLNYGIDLVSAWIYSWGDDEPMGGQRGAMLKAGKSLYLGQNDAAKERKFQLLEDALLEHSRTHPRENFLTYPALCNAIGLSGKAVKTPGTAFMGRDFMFPTANVFQEAWRMLIHVPDSIHSPGLLPVVCGASPGMVGCPVALNSLGVAMGVDVVVTSDVAIEMPSAGLNSLLLVRHVTDNAHDLRSGVDLVVEAHRGCSWLYPLCDGKGDCAVLETGMYMESYPNALDYVINPEELPYLPNQAFIDAHSAESLWEKGVFKRFMNYTYPTDYLDYNQGLFDFKHATKDYNLTAGAWGPNGYVWTDWDLEHQATTHLGSDYFPPQRETYDDVVLVTNHNLIPEAHIKQMGFTGEWTMKLWCDFQWRYDVMIDQLNANYGQFDFAMTKHLIDFLNPSRYPYYSDDEDNTATYYDPWPCTNDNTPQRMQVNGLVAAIDLGNKYMEVLAGYYTDQWVGIHLLNFFNATNYPSK